jgi:hypothetical protein
MKTKIIEYSFLCRVNYRGAIQKIREAGLYERMLHDVKKAEKNKTWLIKEYVEKVKVITFHGDKVYEWR